MQVAVENPRQEPGVVKLEDFGSGCDGRSDTRKKAIATINNAAIASGCDRLPQAVLLDVGDQPGKVVSLRIHDRSPASSMSRIPVLGAMDAATYARYRSRPSMMRPSQVVMIGSRRLFSLMSVTSLVKSAPSIRGKRLANG